MAMLTRRALVGGGVALTASVAGLGHAQPSNLLRHSFIPGEMWLDTAGKPIQAHGGSLIAVGDVFYWYGENKEFTNGRTKIWTWGVRCYSSGDLYNWTDLGLIVPPDENDPTSPLNPRTSSLERPHIVYNANSKKFVCWFKNLAGRFQTRAVLTADKITGPYTLIRRDVRPLGMSAGDFDLVVSADDGKAYMYFERVHSELICADLTEDYTDFTGYYSTHFPRPGPPTVREGPAYFKRHGKHYLASSGTTAYYPNPSEIAVADTFHGPFTLLGDLHPSDRTRTSFNSQICSVFKHPKKKDLYIALADRWVGPQSGTEFESGETSRLVQAAIGKALGPVRGALTPAEVQAMGHLGAKVDTSQSRYVWLPIRFDEHDRPTVEWRAEWSLDEFA